MPNFIDTARITVRSGNGGNGAVAFHREKYVAAGGPDGGDGGHGGDVILKTDRHLSTLMDFRYTRKYVAENGQDGQGKRCTGKDGAKLQRYREAHTSRTRVTEREQRAEKGLQHIHSVSSRR